MSYVLGSLGATAQEINTQLKAAQAEQESLLNQWNDADFKNPPDRQTQARLDPLLAAVGKRVNDLREQLRKLVGGDKNKQIETELTVTADSIWPWILGGAVVLGALAFAARPRQKSIAPT